MAPSSCCSMVALLAVDVAVLQPDDHSPLRAPSTFNMSLSMMFDVRLSGCRLPEAKFCHV